MVLILKEKKAIARLIIAFAIATKDHLRLEPMSRALSRSLSPQQFDLLQRMDNPPLQIIVLIRDYLQKKHEENCVNSSPYSNFPGKSELI